MQTGYRNRAKMDESCGDEGERQPPPLFGLIE
jgi:hypothetical protein